MRHHNNVRKFGRTKNQRHALMKGLVLSLIAHGRIETTEAKAKEVAILKEANRPVVRPVVEQRPIVEQTKIIEENPLFP